MNGNNRELVNPLHHHNQIPSIVPIPQQQNPIDIDDILPLEQTALV